MANNTNFQTTEKVTGTSSNTNAGTGVSKTLYDSSKPSNLSSAASNKTTTFFNNYFSSVPPINSNVNDAIVSFFEKQTGDAESAKILADAVINTAHQQNEDPLNVLDQFRELGVGELNVYLALYLNLSRVNSSLLGVKNVPKTSKYVQRSIIT